MSDVCFVFASAIEKDANKIIDSTNRFSNRKTQNRPRHKTLAPLHILLDSC